MTCRKAMAVAAMLVVGPPLLTACGGQAGRTGAAVTAARHITVLVAATEMRFTLSQRSGPPGAYTFVLSNAGRARHALAIRGPGVAATSEPADGGGEAELTVTLHEGAYTLWCPIGRHRRLGMETGFTVR